MLPEVRARRLGRLAADERAAGLCDPGTFAAAYAAVASASESVPPGDGIVLGVGLVGGRAVSVIATDGRVTRGALGAVGARLAADAIRAAVVGGRPVVLLLDSDGAREAEGVPAVLASAEWLAALADASGAVPLLAAVFGVAGGAAAYGAALCDLCVMINERSFAFVAGPPVVHAALGETSDLATLGGTSLHADVTGFAHVLVHDDRAALTTLRALLASLPASAAAVVPATTPRAPRTSTFTLPPRTRAYDASVILDALVDEHSHLALAPTYGASIQVGLARIEGRAVLVVASQPSDKAGALDAAAAQKLARFVRFAGAFNLPIVTLCDTPGFLPGRAEEARRLLVHGAKVIAAYAEARRSVPLVAVVVRRAVGAGSVLAYGADVVLALPDAEVRQMGPEAARAAGGGIAHASDAEATGFAHRTTRPEDLRGELVRILAVARAPILAPPGGRKTSLVPL